MYLRHKKLIFKTKFFSCSKKLIPSDYNPLLSFYASSKNLFLPLIANLIKNIKNLDSQIFGSLLSINSSQILQFFDGLIQTHLHAIIYNKTRLLSRKNHYSVKFPHLLVKIDIFFSVPSFSQSDLFLDFKSFSNHHFRNAWRSFSSKHSRLFLNVHIFFFISELFKTFLNQKISSEATKNFSQCLQK